MEAATPFDAALLELTRAWKVRDDLRQQGNTDHAAIRAAWLELDRARLWIRKVTDPLMWRYEHAVDPRTWLPPSAADRVAAISADAHRLEVDGIARRLDALVQRDRDIHDHEAVNLDPAANTMNPAAEAMMARGLGSRPSLGYPGAKYETGLEAIEEIEVLATNLVREVFGATFAEVRVPSGAIANLYAFMATASPGYAVIVPPASIGGHVTHHEAGAAGLYGLEVHHAPIDPDTNSVDTAGLAALARRVRPSLITIGGSLNLAHHPVAEIRRIADEVDAKVLFDAAHRCGLIAGHAWPNPLQQGAHLMTMSTYKSLAGPPGGLVVTNDPALAERIEAIAHPGLTANFDAGKTAAMAITMLDWLVHGRQYAADMVTAAADLARGLEAQDLPVHRPAGQLTQVSHQLALDARALGGGTAAAQHLRRANLLTSAIGLPIPSIEGDANGLRMGTPEIVRWGISGAAIPQLAAFIGQAWRDDDPARLAPKVARFRSEFRRIRYIRDR